jgi:hypothetical protein
MRIMLTDTQTDLLRAAAAELAPDSRDAFVTDVLLLLDTWCRCRSPSDRDLAYAIRVTLADAATTSTFLCDSVSNNKHQEATMPINDDDDLDENGLLKDGHALTVPMYAMDAQQKAVREHFGPLGFRDVQGKTPMLDAARAATHRPGFRYAADPYARDEALIALADYDRELQDAYKAPLPHQTEVTGVGAASAPRGAKKGDSCLIGGMEGHLVEIDGELTCIPDSVDDAASLSDREIAHLKYLDHVSNAWRTPGGDVVSDHRPAQRADVAPTRDAVEAAYAAYDAEIQERWRNPI